MIRRATYSDIETIMGIVRGAQLSLCELGIDQWQDGYPSTDVIINDIDLGIGYVMYTDNQVVGYAAIVLTGESAYEQIASLWHTSNNYVVVHRLCIDNNTRRQGIAISLMQHAANMARDNGFNAFRIDTHKGNIRMMSMMQKLGFRHVGRIKYDSGEREAFELELDSSNIL